MRRKLKYLSSFETKQTRAPPKESVIYTNVSSLKIFIKQHFRLFLNQILNFS
jgi:hypothetical protein